MLSTVYHGFYYLSHAHNLPNRGRTMTSYYKQDFLYVEKMPFCLFRHFRAILLKIHIWLFTFLHYYYACYCKKLNFTNAKDRMFKTMYLETHPKSRFKKNTNRNIRLIPTTFTLFAKLIPKSFHIVRYLCLEHAGALQGNCGTYR